MIEAHHPSFSCPLCRTFADLDDDVEVEIDPALLDEGEDSAVEENQLLAVSVIRPPLDRGADTEVELFETPQHQMDEGVDALSDTGAGAVVQPDVDGDVVMDRAEYDSPAAGVAPLSDGSGEMIEHSEAVEGGPGPKRKR